MHQLPRGFDRREHLILTRGHQRRPRRLRHRHAQRRYPRAGLGLEPEPGVPRGTRSEPEPGKQGRRKSLRPRGFAGETTRDGRRRTRERRVRETDRRARRRLRTKIHPSRAARGRRRTFGFRFRLGFGFGAGSRLGRFRFVPRRARAPRRLEAPPRATNADPGPAIPGPAIPDPSPPIDRTRARVWTAGLGARRGSLEDSSPGEFRNERAAISRDDDATRSAWLRA